MHKVFGFISRRKVTKESSEASPPFALVESPIQSPQLSTALGSPGPFQQIFSDSQPMTPQTMAAEVGDVFYAGLRMTLEALRGPAAAFPPLKAAIEGTISILAIADVCTCLTWIILWKYLP